MLLENVWDYHFDPQTNVIDVHVSRLRQKIDRNFERPLLHTVRGAGYCLRARSRSRSVRQRCAIRRRAFRRGPPAGEAGQARPLGPPERRAVRLPVRRGIRGAGWRRWAASAPGADACVPAGGALFPGIRAVGDRRPALRLLDERRFRRAADRGDARRRDHRPRRAIRAARPERPRSDRRGAQRRRPRRRHALSRDQPARAGRSPATSPTGRPGCRRGPGRCRFSSTCTANGSCRTAPGARHAVRDPGRLPPARRARHQRRRSLSRPHQDDAACGRVSSRSRSA